MSSETEPKNKKPRMTKFRRAAQEFDDLIHRSPAVSWIGMVEGIDSLERPAIDVYLSERTAVSDVDIPTIVDSFSEIIFAVRPELHAYLHLVPDDHLSQADLQAAIDKMCQADTRRKLIWQEDLINH